MPGRTAQTAAWYGSLLHDAGAKTEDKSPQSRTLPPVLTMFTLLAVLNTADPEADLAPPPQKDGVSLDDQRVKRFVGALIGGAVGLAIPIAISAPNCSPANLSCTSSFQNFTLGIMPLFAGLGAYFGHHLMGGEAEYPFATMGAGIGSLLGMMTLLFAESIGVAPAAIFPFAAGAAGLTTFLMAILLDTRDHSIASLPASGHATGARLWATFGAAVGIGIAGAFVGVLLAILNPFGGFISGLAFLAAVPFVSWGVHNMLDGRGSLGSAYLGLLISVAVMAAIAVPVQVLSASLGSGTTFYSFQQGALIAGSAFLAVLVGPLVALEMSHSEEVREAGLKPSFSFSPVPGGAIVGGGIRF